MSFVIVAKSDIGCASINGNTLLIISRSLRLKLGIPNQSESSCVFPSVVVPPSVPLPPMPIVTGC